MTCSKTSTEVIFCGQSRPYLGSSHLGAAHAWRLIMHLQTSQNAELATDRRTECHHSHSDEKQRCMNRCACGARAACVVRHSTMHVVLAAQGAPITMQALRSRTLNNACRPRRLGCAYHNASIAKRDTQPAYGARCPGRPHCKERQASPCSPGCCCTTVGSVRTCHRRCCCW